MGDAPVRAPEAAAGFKSGLLELAVDMGRADLQVQGDEGPTLLAISRALRAT